MIVDHAPAPPPAAALPEALHGVRAAPAAVPQPAHGTPAAKAKAIYLRTKKSVLFNFALHFSYAEDVAEMQRLFENPSGAAGGLSALLDKLSRRAAAFRSPPDSLVTIETHVSSEPVYIRDPGAEVARRLVDQLRVTAAGAEHLRRSKLPGAAACLGPNKEQQLTAFLRQQPVEKVIFYISRGYFVSHPPPDAAIVSQLAAASPDAVLSFARSRGVVQLSPAKRVREEEEEEDKSSGGDGDDGISDGSKRKRMPMDQLKSRSQQLSRLHEGVAAVQRATDGAVDSFLNVYLTTPDGKRFLSAPPPPPPGASPALPSPSATAAATSRCLTDGTPNVVSFFPHTASMLNGMSVAANGAVEAMKVFLAADLNRSTATALIDNLPEAMSVVRETLAPLKAVARESLPQATVKVLKDIKAVALSSGVGVAASFLDVVRTYFRSLPSAWDQAVHNAQFMENERPVVAFVLSGDGTVIENVQQWALAARPFDLPERFSTEFQWIPLTIQEGTQRHRTAVFLPVDCVTRQARRFATTSRPRSIRTPTRYSTPLNTESSWNKLTGPRRLFSPSSTSAPT